MRSPWISLLGVLAIVAGAGCSSSSSGGSNPDQSGGEMGTGGSDTTGTGESSTGGSVASGTGGSATGGSATGGSTGGSDPSGTGGSQAGPCSLVDCGDNTRCVEDGNEATCECLEGYSMDDASGDCLDIDECADVGLNDCALRATCTNTEGSHTCECDAPAYAGDGKDCACADGYAPATDDPSFCLADDGGECSDDLECGSGFCISGVCCASGCLTPPACGTVEGATCADGVTCEYPVADDGTDCDDGDACTVAACQAGTCTSTGNVSCDLGNPCMAAACDSLLGCSYTPVAGSCDDGNPCTTGDTCDAGACIPGTPMTCDDSNPCTDDSCSVVSDQAQCNNVANTNTCAAPDSCATAGQCQAGACAPVGNACGPNATLCAVGTPNTCTCATDFVDSNGTCVPQTDECALAQSPCVAGASCFDPSSNGGDVQCTCPTGFTGDGLVSGNGCADIDECASDPCGMASGWATGCSQPSPGTYACACAAGFTEVGGSCVCNMEGTFAVRVTATLNYEPATPGLLEGYTGVTAYSYILRTHAIDAQGNVQVTEKPCGGDTPDTCTQPNILFFSKEAYGGNIPNSAWDSPAITSLSSSFPAANAYPGAAYKTTEDAMVLGMTLANPTGPWPATAGDVTAWTDPDGDGALGVTTLWKDASAGTSTACSRVNTTDPRYTYALPPTPSFNRVTKVYGASRVIKAYDGTFASCDSITGTVTGPDNGQYKAEARVWGCVRSNGTACSASERDFFDGATADSPYVTGATFVMKRMSAGPHTCAEVRSFAY